VRRIVSFDAPLSALPVAGERALDRSAFANDWACAPIATHGLWWAGF